VARWIWLRAAQTRDRRHAATPAKGKFEDRQGNGGLPLTIGADLSTWLSPTWPVIGFDGGKITPVRGPRPASASVAEGDGRGPKPHSHHSGQGPGNDNLTPRRQKIQLEYAAMRIFKRFSIR